MAVSSVQVSGTSSPNATSHNTGSRTPTADHGYLIAVHSFRSTTVDTVSVTGQSITWTELTNLGRQWTTSGVLRRTQVFKGYAGSSPTTGALTITYDSGNTPEILDWDWLDLGVTTSSVIVSGSEKRLAAGGSITGNTLTESLTMNAVADSRNRWVSGAISNVNSTTFRGELDADTNGDADWISGTAFGSNTTRSRKHNWCWIDATTDSTPGWLVTDTASWYTWAAEIDYAVASTITATMVGGGSTASPAMTATPKTPKVATLVGGGSSLSAVMTATPKTPKIATLVGGGAALNASMIATVISPPVEGSDLPSDLILGLGINL